jgi:hypothetical protein
LGRQGENNCAMSHFPVSVIRSVRSDNISDQIVRERKLVYSNVVRWWIFDRNHLLVSKGKRWNRKIMIEENEIRKKNHRNKEEEKLIK